VADSLKAKTLHALSWTFIEAVGFQGIRFLLGIILARLLFPDQFGLVGMLLIFTMVAQSLLDSGFGAALIQKRNITHIDTCSIFYFNIVVGIAVAILLYLVAPAIAAFYKQPTLTALMRVLTLEIVINSLGLIQSVIFTKQINFKILTKINLVASVLSGLLGIIMAFLGFGVWSSANLQRAFSDSLSLAFQFLAPVPNF
jgi:teichuronic acid exporter